MPAIDPVLVSTSVNVPPATAFEIVLLEEFLDQLHAWPHGCADAWRVFGERYGYTLAHTERDA